MLEETLMKFQLVKHKCYLQFIRLKPKVNQKKSNKAKEKSMHKQKDQIQKINKQTKQNNNKKQRIMQMMLTRNAAFTKNKQSVELKCYVFMAIN